MTTKEEYIEALERMEGAYYNFDGCMSSMNKFKEDINILTGLVNEHFEERAEMNFEHYFEYLSKLNMSDFALIDGRVVQCLGTSCSKCDFNGDCVERKFKWLKQPYKKPIYKLSRFEYDLLRTNNLSHDKKLKDFATYENLREIGYFKDIDFDLTINEVIANCEVIQFEFVED